MNVAPNYGPFGMGAYQYEMSLKPHYLGFQIPESIMDFIVEGNTRLRQTSENLHDSEGFAEVDLNEDQPRYVIEYTQVQRDIRTLKSLGNILDYIKGLNKTTSLQSEVWGYFIEIAHEMKISLKGEFVDYLNLEYPQLKAGFLAVLKKYPTQTEENQRCIVM